MREEEMREEEKGITRVNVTKLMCRQCRKAQWTVSNGQVVAVQLNQYPKPVDPHIPNITMW